MQNAYSFAAIRGVQSGRAHYIAMVPMSALVRLTGNPTSPDNPQEQASSRRVSALAAEIARILQNIWCRQSSSPPKVNCASTPPS